VRHRQRWCERSVRGGDDKVKNVILIMSRKIYVLHEIEGREQREKLTSERIGVVIEMDIEVTGNDKPCGVVAAIDRKEVNSSRKTEKGLEKVEDSGGR